MTFGVVAERREERTPMGKPLDIQRSAERIWWATPSESLGETRYTLMGNPVRVQHAPATSRPRWATPSWTVAHREGRVKVREQEGGG